MSARALVSIGLQLGFPQVLKCELCTVVLFFLEPIIIAQAAEDFLPYRELLSVTTFHERLDFAAISMTTSDSN